MMGCRWSATRGMLMLVGGFGMVMLISATRMTQPPAKNDPQPRHAESLRQRVEAAASRAHQQAQPAEEELSAILDDFHDAASKADFDRYFKHWSPASVFLGTDATERWTGQEFKDFAKPYFDKGKGWTYHPHDRHIQIAPGGEAGFFDELLDNDKLGLCRGSGVLRKMQGEWWIMQYNLSIPVPNDLAERVVGLIKQGAPKAPEGERKHQE